MGTGNMSRAVSILSLLLVLSLFSTGHAVQVQLVWDAPTTNADGTPLTDLAGYKVYYGQSSRNYGSPVDVGNQTTYILAGLSRGETYYFAVTAYDTSGNESEFSEEVTYTVPAVDTDGDGLFDDEEIDVYGTDPTLADTDGDGLNDGEEVAFWGEEWSLDIDGDGLSNLLDADSDGDGFEDGVEVSQGFDPGDPHSFPTLELVKIWQEAEDGELDGAMKVAVDSDASMEQFIWVPYENEGIPTPPDATGEATYRFVIPEAGTYALWGRLQAGEEGTGAFSLALDGGEIYSWWEIPALSGTGNVYDLSPSTYQVGTVQVGETYYIDRSYTITEVPAGLEGLTLIKTANSDKGNDQAEFLSFTVDQAVTLYVAYDSRATRYPDWLTGAYTPTGQTIMTTDVPLSVWSREFPAGTITLPGNQYGNPSGVGSNYIVLLAFHATDASQTWVWVEARDTGETLPVRFWFEAGEHTLQVKAQEKGVKLDRILLTNDLEYVPQDRGEYPDFFADFTATPLRGTTPLTVAFTDTSAGNITAWIWDFGDGTTSQEQHPTHTYKKTGFYTVRLTVIGEDGSSATETKTDYIAAAICLKKRYYKPGLLLWWRIYHVHPIPRPVLCE